ncbi:amidohydrolase [Nafulsella turpanensis]|uniref:amidohydrolase n=1 Tax=Nafulsella turpanensis TaxID=1265690 RepID=UPI00034C62F1|nr:amidohydrolase [Nafulsella turpanensis]
MQDLTISLIQSPLHWQEVEANLAQFEEKIWQISGKPDLIMLPEMFNTGFSMAAEQLAEPMNSKTFRWMKQQAAQSKAVVVGSFIVKEEGKYYNRLLWMEPDGQYATYDKRHLFRMADEHHHYSMGKNRLVRELKGWRVCPLVCYDLRFPVWSRNINAEGELDYDLLLYVANWPQARVNAWNVLLQARAVENLCYVAGLNRVGTDGNGIAYNGCSAVVDPKGQRLFFAEEQPSIHTITLSKEALLNYREKFPAQLDADRFTIQK